MLETWLVSCLMLVVASGNECVIVCRNPPLLSNVSSFVAGEFELTIAPGEFTDSEIIVMLGENGTGKTTFIRMLAGRIQPDSGGRCDRLYQAIASRQACVSAMTAYIIKNNFPHI